MVLHGTPEYVNKGFGLGTSVAAIQFPHMNISWERFVRQQLECLAVLNKIMEHEILEIALLQTFFSISWVLFSPISHVWTNV